MELTHGRPLRGRSSELSQRHRLAAEIARALAFDTEGHRAPIQRLIVARDAEFFQALLLVSSAQCRLLAHMCMQVSIDVDPSPVDPAIATLNSQMVVDRYRGILHDSLRLFPDHSYVNGGDDEDGPWLSAMSTVRVGRREGFTLVDAGPSIYATGWSGALAAPISLTPIRGVWPVNAVKDALWISESSVRWWIGRSVRSFHGDQNQHLMLHPRQPLERTLISPAARRVRELIRDVPSRRFPADTVDEALDELPDAVPFTAAEIARDDVARRGFEKSLKDPPEFDRLDMDWRSPNALNMESRRMTSDALAVTSLYDTQDLGRRVAVGVNVTLPDRVDADRLVADIKKLGGIRVEHPLVTYFDQDVHLDSDSRVSLIVDTDRGIPVHKDYGDLLILAPGTELALLGVERNKRHSTVYLKVV